MSSFLLWLQICSQLSTRLEKQQAATKEELDAVRVRGDLSLFGEDGSVIPSDNRKSSFSPPHTADVGVAAELDNHREILSDGLTPLPDREAGGHFQSTRDMRLKKRRVLEPLGREVLLELQLNAALLSVHSSEAACRVELHISPPFKTQIVKC